MSAQAGKWSHRCCLTSHASWKETNTCFSLKSRHILTVNQQWDLQRYCLLSLSITDQDRHLAGAASGRVSLKRHHGFFSMNKFCFFLNLCQRHHIQPHSCFWSCDTALSVKMSDLSQQSSPLFLLCI